ncbi:uncharacterized protein OCT59_006364 [Rhizophagus irregularis]|uniref:uncharacterized protein n=1 Tax=Rhizophagus irregularis TaxID=588596 RepID=UPI003326E919|nr:hypothetical protein OCT59_006364 [Rhizophagus irregularis]
MFIQNNNKIIKEAVTATLEVISPVSDIFLITNIIPSDIFIQIRNAYAVIDLNLSISNQSTPVKLSSSVCKLGTTHEMEIKKFFRSLLRV